MKFWFPQYFNAKSRFLSYTVVYAALVKSGHEVVGERCKGVDAALFSMCDVTEYNDLIKARKESVGLPLIVGGSFAYNFWSAFLYCDCVWVGEIYDFAECSSLDEIYNSKYSFIGQALPWASRRIEWARAPIAQISKDKCYYWAGNGCKNKCRFCFTSWTRPHQTNSRQRVDRAVATAKLRRVHIMLSSNEYENAPGSRTFDMLMRDFVRTPVSAGVVRCGVEFATESSRKRNGKSISNNMIFHALQKAGHEKISLRLFHITGYDKLDDWNKYIAMWQSMLEKVKYKQLLNLVFNNLQYQNYTPLYKERKQINPENYITHEITREWYNRLRQVTTSILIGAPSPFQKVACRMGCELATNKEQAKYWASMMRDPAKRLTVQGAYDALFSTGVMETPALKLNHTTGEITVEVIES